MERRGFILEEANEGLIGSKRDLKKRMVEFKSTIQTPHIRLQYQGVDVRDAIISIRGRFILMVDDEWLDCEREDPWGRNRKVMGCCNGFYVKDGFRDKVRKTSLEIFGIYSELNFNNMIDNQSFNLYIDHHNIPLKGKDLDKVERAVPEAISPSSGRRHGIGNFKLRLKGRRDGLD